MLAFNQNKLQKKQNSKQFNNNQQALIKSFNNYIKKGTVLSVPATIGYYIDTKNPYYIIGLNKIDLPRKDLILLELHKKFYKHVKFEFIDIDDESELSTKLKKQGKEIPF